MFDNVFEVDPRCPKGMGYLPASIILWWEYASPYLYSMKLRMPRRNAMVQKEKPLAWFQGSWWI